MKWNPINTLDVLQRECRRLRECAEHLETAEIEAFSEALFEISAWIAQSQPRPFGREEHADPEDIERLLIAARHLAEARKSAAYAENRICTFLEPMRSKSGSGQIVDLPSAKRKD